MSEPIQGLTEREWRSIAAVLPTARRMKGRHDDRAIVGALLFAEAEGISVEAVAPRCGINIWTLRSRVLRWKANGVWPKLMARGQPAVRRMRNEIGAGDLLTQLAEACGWDRL